MSACRPYLLVCSCLSNVSILVTEQEEGKEEVEQSRAVCLVPMSSGGDPAEEIRGRVVVFGADADDIPAPITPPSITTSPPVAVAAPLETERNGGSQEQSSSSSNSNSNNSSNSEKTKKIAPHPPAALRDLFRFADGLDCVLMCIGTLGALVHGCSLPVFLRFFADLVDSFGSHAEEPETMVRLVVKYALYFLVVGAAIWASSWAEISCWMWTGERQSTRMRIRYLEAALRQDVSFFDTDVRTSDVIYAINADAVVVQDAISEKLGNLIHYMATFVAGFVVGFTAAWKLALVTLAVVPLIAVIGGLSAAALAKLSSRSQDALSEASNIAEQALAQIRVVQAFVGEDRAMRAYSAALSVAQRIGYRSGFAKGLGLGGTYFTVFCCYALLLWYGGHLVRRHHTNGGLAIATMFSVMIGGIALGQSAPSMAAFAKARIAAANIFRIIDHQSVSHSSQSVEDERELQSVSGRVEMRRVDFAYPSRPDVPILRGFSLAVPAGKTIALVGSSGSGKSTVVSLIERFYDPNAGQILLDGHDLRTLNLRWLRQQIGLVSQEPTLFATTIKENLLLGRDSNTATTAEMEEGAARVANAHTSFKLPSRLPTLGEAGAGGAGPVHDRAHDAGDRAHRLSTVRKADLVAVLHGGAVSEMGTHDELMAKGEDGAYARLIRMQEQAHVVAAARRSSARPSSARNSVSSPIMTRNSSYGRSPYSRRLSDLDFHDAAAPSVMMMKNNEKKVAFRAGASSLWRLAKMNSPELGYALLGSVASMVCGSFSAIFAYVLSAVLSVYYASDSRTMEREIAKYCYVLVGMSSAALLFNTAQHVFWDTVGENLTKRVREKMFGAVLRNEMAWFDAEENASARVAGRLALDAQNVRSAIGDRISVIVHNCALLMVACTAGRCSSRGFSGDLEGAHARATQIAGEAVANVRTVAAFNAEAKITGLFEANLGAPLRRCFWKGQIARYGYATRGAVPPLRVLRAGTLWYAAWLVKHTASPTSPRPSAIRVLMVVLMANGANAETLTLAPDFVKGGRAMRSVFETIDRKTEVEPDDVDAAPVPDRPRGEVDLRHVDFSYPTRPDVQVLQDLSLRARAGKTLALVGPSGCGKSSVLALVHRFYEPSSGRLLLDGKDLRKYNLRALRRIMALVPQEPMLFAATIHDNIAYGAADDNVTEAEVVEAATLANAHKFISALPDGYRTLVGERGVQLSGGQRQRIAVARALVRRAAVMLLDEATSALDAESERCVQEALMERSKTLSTTTIVVAHRLATVRNAHSIAVIDEGKVVEQGSHSHLLTNHPEGCYARMLQLQRLTLPPPGPSSSSATSS
ncbi:hypothetical protein PR202_ga21839 [Eleusine coracana subsp. coracana]|uniref:Uncharacterized protein n=1 Tax=Eleusine coracana subsp. coracana TaxID=191504 RepID=A0AAV5D2N6_ELECO|nr:hypothetical protein PR202_ga21839 [Eleusine coracana subsp. coracana]